MLLASLIDRLINILARSGLDALQRLCDKRNVFVIPRAQLRKGQLAHKDLLALVLTLARVDQGQLHKELGRRAAGTC